MLGSLAVAILTITGALLGAGAAFASPLRELSEPLSMLLMGTALIGVSVAAQKRPARERAPARHGRV